MNQPCGKETQGMLIEGNCSQTYWKPVIIACNSENVLFSSYYVPDTAPHTGKRNSEQVNSVPPNFMSTQSLKNVARPGHKVFADIISWEQVVLDPGKP